MSDEVRDAPPAAGPQPSVDQLLIALQKTFSRVSRDSAGLAKDDARALIAGPVEFELMLGCSLTGDRLHVCEGGGMPLRLKGRVLPDLGIEVANEADDG